MLQQLPGGGDIDVFREHIVEDGRDGGVWMAAPQRRHEPSEPATTHYDLTERFLMPPIPKPHPVDDIG